MIMKILLASDSHRDIRYFMKVIEKEKPNLILFTGDHSDDALDLSSIYENIPFYIVKGNCDYYDNITKDTIIVDIEGMGKVMLTHGHLFSVKSTMNEIYAKAVLENVNYVIFGHTHIRHKSEFNNIIFINPGAIVNHEYAIFENGDIEYKGENL